MSGPEILSIIHLVGWGFIFLWIMATGFKLGMWNNALIFMNWVLAFFFGMIIGLPVGGMIIGAVKPDMGDPYTPFAIAAGAFWLVSLMAFAGLQVLTDSLSKVKVTFHPVVETLGSLAFSFSTFLAIATATLPMLGLVRLHVH
ncbi:MAG TPA: hypothetical protein VJ783_06570 [Pirellulales bacterium]|nr:hypothetical protein [Pirellulales bacterium]